MVDYDKRWKWREWRGETFMKYIVKLAESSKERKPYKQRLQTMELRAKRPKSLPKERSCLPVSRLFC
ncbi:hypothetical protein X975_21612, partial [Stegodyphus mimosarum]